MLEPSMDSAFAGTAGVFPDSTKILRFDYSPDGMINCGRWASVYEPGIGLDGVLGGTKRPIHHSDNWYVDENGISNELKNGRIEND